MTPEELDELRAESKAFLRSVQSLEGFNSRRKDLGPPPVALTMPLWSIRRLLAFPGDPIENDEAQKAQGTGLLDGSGGEVAERPRPTSEELTELAGYERRLRLFAQRYLSRAQWGARATHVALRVDGPITLPRAAPDRRIPLPHSSVSGRELLEIAAAHQPRSELRGDRSKTWSEAITAIESRLLGGKAHRRDPLARAARYLDAAVNGRLARAGEYVDPLEPSDHRDYEQQIEKRFRGEGRLSEISKGLMPGDS